MDERDDRNGRTDKNAGNRQNGTAEKAGVPAEPAQTGKPANAGVNHTDAGGADVQTPAKRAGTGNARATSTGVQASAKRAGADNAKTTSADALVEAKNSSADTQTTRGGWFSRVGDWCRRHALSVDSVAASAVSGYLTASFCALLTDTNFSALSFVENLSRGQFWAILLLVFAALQAVGILTRRKLIPCVGLALSTLLFCVSYAVAAGNLWMGLGLLLPALVVVRYVTKQDGLNPDRILFSSRMGWALTGLGVLLFTLVVGYASSIRYTAFLSNTFDFGLFAQMFEGMARTGTPVTTLERNVELSHFAVHFSPFFYVLLPGYMIFRSPLYLIWVQAFGVAAGAFAVYGIARRLKLLPSHAAGCAFLYLLYPAFSRGCFYDFHENKFLPVTVLFLVYFLLRQVTDGEEGTERSLPAGTPGGGIGRRSAGEADTGFLPWLRQTGRAWLRFLPALGCAFLVLSVKEDAAVYVAAVALWVILTQKKKWRGAVLFVLSVAYLGFAVRMISHFGGELLVGRYQDFLREGNSFTDVLKECFYGIGRFFRIVFTENKGAYLLWMFVPVLFAPFFTKKQGTLVLLLPMLLINLMSSDKYQFDVAFQYTFGVGALILVSFVLMLADRKPEIRGRTLVIALSFSLILTASLTFPTVGYYIERFGGNRAYYAEAEQVLYDSLPADASVSANSSLTAHLYRFRDVHSVGTSYWTPEKTDYYVLRNDTTFKYKGKEYKTGVSFLEEYYPDQYERVGGGEFFDIYRLR